MNQSKLYIVLIAFCLCSQCSKELPFPDADADDIVVMNGLISPENSPRIHLSHSCHLTNLNCINQNIENGKVLLLDEAGNELAELTHHQDGVYVTNGFAIEYNKTYRIEASVPGYEKISSVTTTPKAFSSNIIATDEKTISEYVCWTMDIEIEDNPDEENYYLINGWIDILNGFHQDGISEVNGYEIPHSGMLTNDLNSVNQALASSIDIIEYPLDFVFLTDENFNGETYTVEVGIYDADTRVDKDYLLEAHISAKSVSKEMYDYYISVVKYKLNAGNLFAEPEQILSNIEDGIGIFSAFTEHNHIVELPQSEYYLPDGFFFENEGCNSPCTIRFFSDMGSKLSYTWDFGDGSVSSELNPEHEYSEPGTYFVTLEITLGDDSFGYSQEIEIF